MMNMEVYSDEWYLPHAYEKMRTQHFSQTPSI